MRKHNRVFRTHAAARGATFATVVWLLDENRVNAINAVDAEQTKIDALHTVRTATVIDDRVPASATSLFDAIDFAFAADFLFSSVAI